MVNQRNRVLVCRLGLGLGNLLCRCTRGRVAYEDIKCRDVDYYFNVGMAKPTTGSFDQNLWFLSQQLNLLQLLVILFNTLHVPTAIDIVNI